jgi:hypothetical protein
MAREIDLVVDSARKGCRIIEDGTGILWNLADLVEAWSDCRFQVDDVIAPPDPNSDLTSLYPGCPQQRNVGKQEAYHVFGWTSHFVIFEPLGAASMSPK